MVIIWQSVDSKDSKLTVPLLISRLLTFILKKCQSYDVKNKSMKTADISACKTELLSRKAERTLLEQCSRHVMLKQHRINNDLT